MITHALTSPPEIEPISYLEAKLHLRVTHDLETNRIHALIRAAREWVERMTNRQLITAEREARYDGAPTAGWLEIPHPPLQTVDAITYLDTDGERQTWDDDHYVVDIPNGPTAEHGRVTPAYGLTWPLVRSGLGSFVVAYTAGYGDAPSDVPQTLIEAMYLRLGELYDRRMDDRDETSRALGLVTPYRLELLQVCV